MNGFSFTRRRKRSNTIFASRTLAARQQLEPATRLQLGCRHGRDGVIENNRVRCMLSVLINTHLLATGHRGVNGFFFFFSSACVYAADKQVDTHNPDLR